MPVLKASIKSSRQDVVRRERRQPYKTRMKTVMRKIQDLVKEGKMEDAKKALPEAHKAIDMAAKKEIIHWKNAARKKSLLSRLVAVKK